MKFRSIFLLPFLLSLTSCTSDLSVKTDAGESYYVPENTVITTSYDKDDFLIKFKALQESRANSYLGFIEQNNSAFENCDDGSLSTEQCLDIYKPEKTKNEYQAEYDSILNQMNLSLKKYENEILAGIHWVKIRYKPVYKNLNGEKRVLESAEVACFNPDLNKEVKDMWNDLEKYDSKLFKEIIVGIRLERKLCEKYAKF
tara:strand:+ start:226 stop:825 length:600 start_codon:yes stop_codon:yes gene_type:complete